MTTEPIRDKKDTTALVYYYRDLRQYRNHALIIMGLYTALRISDLLQLTWDDVYDYKNKCIKEVISLFEQKTGKYKILALNNEIITALQLMQSETPIQSGEAIFVSRKTRKAIGRVQAYRIIRHAAEALNFNSRVSCHSLRKTFGYHAWKKGVSPAIIMDIYNHNSLAVTRRYLGISQDDKNEVYLNLNFII